MISIFIGENVCKNKCTILVIHEQTSTQWKMKGKFETKSQTDSFRDYPGHPNARQCIENLGQSTSE